MALIWALVALIIPLVIGFYFYINHKYSYWREQGLAGPKPSFFQFGNVMQIEGSDPSEIELELFRKYGKVYGNYTGFKPTLTIIDNELIKQVLVKDFPSFIDRRTLNSYHELVNLGQFFTDGTHWKKIRMITGPTFTTKKLKGMYVMMDRCVDHLTKQIDDIAAQGEGHLEIKKLVIGFTLDVVAATSFATDVRTTDRNSPLIKHALKFLDISPLRALFYFSMPRWINYLAGVEHFFNVESFQFTSSLIKAIIAQRRESKEKHNDLVQLLMDAYVYENELDNSNYEKLVASMEIDETDDKQKETTNRAKATLTENEIIAQGILFFVAGFETTTSAVTTCLFELTQNEDIQERLFEELTQSLDHLKPASDEYFDTLVQIPYLDAVIKESMRKYPPVKRLERRLGVEQYRIGDILLKKDQLVEISNYAVHHNPEYYPEPEVFNPERFMPENRPRLVPYTYLPFGQGPRNCIGMRFAYQEIKILLAKIVRRYKFSPAADTPAKLKFDAFKPSMSPKPFSIKVSRR